MIGFLTQAVQEAPLPQSDVEIWGRYLLQTLTIVGGFIVSIYTLKRKQDVIETKVDKVTQLSEPTGNGYAAKTLANDEKILAWLQKLSDNQAEDRRVMTHHLEHHLDKQ